MHRPRLLLAPTPAALWSHRIGMIGVAPLAFLIVTLFALVFTVVGEWRAARDLCRHTLDSWRLGWNGDWI